jgi:hypothetical protein
MGIDVRAMVLEETGAIIEFLHGTTPEHLAMLIVDPRLPPAAAWRERDERENALAIERRTRLATLGVQTRTCRGWSRRRACDPAHWAGAKFSEIGHPQSALVCRKPHPLRHIQMVTRAITKGAFSPWSMIRGGCADASTREPGAPCASTMRAKSSMRPTMRRFTGTAQIWFTDPGYGILGPYEGLGGKVFAGFKPASRTAFAAIAMATCAVAGAGVE